MEYLLYLVGLIIGVAVFLYLLAALESGKKTIKKIATGNKSAEPPALEVEPQHIFHKKHGRAPGQRICPLCGSVLTRYESLYASPIKTREGQKILIHGCRYCYPSAGSDEKSSANVKS